jgi:hypothetical protein
MQIYLQVIRRSQLPIPDIEHRFYQAMLACISDEFRVVRIGSFL